MTDSPDPAAIRALEDRYYVDQTVPAVGEHRPISFNRHTSCVVCCGDQRLVDGTSQPAWPCRPAALAWIDAQAERLARENESHDRTLVMANEINGQLLADLAATRKELATKHQAWVEVERAWAEQQRRRTTAETERDQAREHLVFSQAERERVGALLSEARGEVEALRKAYHQKLKAMDYIMIELGRLGGFVKDQRDPLVAANEAALAAPSTPGRRGGEKRSPGLCHPPDGAGPGGRAVTAEGLPVTRPPRTGREGVCVRAGVDSGRFVVRQGAWVDPAMLRLLWSEKEFHSEVEGLAARNGWVAFHDRDPRMNHAGLPDLLLLRERVVWAELKRESGKLRPAQKVFIARLRAAGQEVYVWKPSDWDEIERVLR